MKKSYKYLYFLLCATFLFSNKTILFAKDVYLGGDSIGIEMKKNGVIVSGTYDIVIDNKIYNPDNDTKIDIGDVIIEFNNNKIKNSKDFVNNLINLEEDTNIVNLKLKRANNYFNENINIIKKDGSFKTGLYIKDKILGVGTITYYDPENNNYGALGHEIIDSDTNEIFNDFQGEILESNVDGYKKSTNGNPGEKIATISNNKIGNILINTKYGIYGEYNNKPDSILISTAKMDEVILGPAQIATVLNNDKIEYFDINIIKLNKQKEIATKGISFEIVDDDLLNKTNGIIQGMSGSPIIQNDKLIGAVTHVITNDVKKGYGIYIDFMLFNSNSI